MRRLLTMLLATTTAMTVFVGVGASTASPAAASTTFAVNASSISPDVRAFRLDVRSNLAGYLTRYRDRLTIDERRQMSALAAQVDRQLTLVQVKVARAERIAQSGASATIKQAAARDASVAFDAAYASATTKLAEVEPILRPKLSILEGIEAKMDLDDQLGRFESLGERIHAFETAQGR